MAEFTPLEGGGHKSGSSSKKKKQQMMMLAGGVGVVLLVLLLSKSGGGSSSQDVVYADMPTPDASQRLDNFASIMSEQNNANLNAAIKDLNSVWGTEFKDMQDNFASQLKEMQDGYNTQMKEMQEANKALNQQNQQWMRDSMDHLKDSMGNGAIQNEADPLWTIGSSSSSFNQDKYDSDIAKLQEDRGALKKELERAHSVYQWRKNNGMDTGAQERYIEQLNGM